MVSVLLEVCFLRYLSSSRGDVHWALYPGSIFGQCLRQLTWAFILLLTMTDPVLTIVAELAVIGLIKFTCSIKPGDVECNPHKRCSIMPSTSSHISLRICDILYNSCCRVLYNVVWLLTHFMVHDKDQWIPRARDQDYAYSYSGLTRISKWYPCLWLDDYLSIADQYHHMQWNTKKCTY